MLEPLCLKVDRVTLELDGVRVITDVSVGFSAGAITGVVGPNGAGKTSLFNVISGLLKPSCGEIYFGQLRLTGQAPFRIARCGVVRLFQSPQVFGTLTALANVQLASLRGKSESWATALLWPLLGYRTEFAARDEAMRCLDLVGLSQSADVLAGELSFGQQKLLNFAGIIAVRPRCLLLDEPTAGLSLETADQVLRLSRSLASEGCAVVLIEHNRQAVSRFCDSVLEMDQGRLREARSIVASPPISAMRLQESGASQRELRR